MASDGPPPGARCRSCGRAATPLRPVRRRYLVEGEDAGALVVSAPEAEVEWWCPSCRSVYPHEPGGD